MWIGGLAVSGLGTILGGVNFITTIVCLRAPGMTMFRMPIFTWNSLVTSLLILLAFPILTAALFGAAGRPQPGCADLLPRERRADALAAPVLVLRPPRGLHHRAAVLRHRHRDHSRLPRKPLFGYKGMIGATMAIGFLSLAVWAHHMFATGAVLLPFFSFLTYLIAVPTGLKFFNWIGTMWRGQLTFETPMLWSIGFMVTFLLGGLTGVLLASPPLDWQVTDSYFVVAHFHYVVFGTVVFAAYGGIYFWFPKMCGRMMDERLGKLHFWMTFIGFHGTFLIQHWLGDEGMPRRYADYRQRDGFTTLNMISTIFVVRPRRLDHPVPLQRGEVVEVRAAGAARRPLGSRQLAGVGDLLAAAAAQLRGDPADPLRAPGVRGPLPAPDGPAPGRSPRRQAARALRRASWSREPDRGRARTTPTRPEPSGRLPQAAVRARVVGAVVLVSCDLARRRAPPRTTRRRGRRCSPCGPACP